MCMCVCARVCVCVRVCVRLAARLPDLGAAPWRPLGCPGLHAIRPPARTPPSLVALLLTCTLNMHVHTRMHMCAHTYTRTRVCTHTHTLSGFASVASQCEERVVYLSPATLVVVPNTMLVPHWKQQIQVRVVAGRGGWVCVCVCVRCPCTQDSRAALATNTPAAPPSPRLLTVTHAHWPASLLLPCPPARKLSPHPLTASCAPPRRCTRSTAHCVCAS